MSEFNGKMFYIADDLAPDEGKDWMGRELPTDPAKDPLKSVAAEGIAELELFLSPEVQHQTAERGLEEMGDFLIRASR